MFSGYFYQSILVICSILIILSIETTDASPTSFFTDSERHNAMDIESFESHQQQQQLPANVRVIAQGYNWLENLAFDCKSGAIFASAWKDGYLLRIDANGTASHHLTGVFQHLLGMAVSEELNVVNLAVSYSNGSNAIVQFDLSDPDRYEVFAMIPKGHRPNGVGLHHRTGYVYTSSEGNQLPGDGHVYRISPQGVVTTLSTSLWSADGLYIDQKRDLLYVGQLWNNKVATFNISESLPMPQLIDLSGSHGFGQLDDFSLAQGGAFIVGGAWTKGDIVVFPSNGHNSTAGYKTLLSGLNGPTSARFGCSNGGPYNSSSLFITEAGSLIFSHRARLLQYVDVPLSPP
jgi:sugar lactone lactonase YvrE